MPRHKTAWVRQRPKQVRKVGKDRASWYVEWREPDGTQRCESYGPGRKGKRAAERRRDRIQAELLTETYQRRNTDKTWDEFCKEIRQTVLTGSQPTTQKECLDTLKRFKRIVKPKRVSAITAQTIAKFIAQRSQERGKKPGSILSPATLNKDLRNLRAVLRIAAEWGYLEVVPKIKMHREPEKLPRYVPPEDFAAIYEACDTARLPVDQHYSAAEWWRGLVVIAYMTGWRIGEILSLRWSDVDLDAATAITRHRNNKGHRDAKVALHPVVIEHIRPLKTFDPLVFPWDYHRRTLASEFARIQDAAGIYLPCPDAGEPDHGQCTPACHRYCFHDERRAFATMNAPNMSRETLQVLMRHQSPDTTARYINMARQLNPALESLHVPDVLQRRTAVGD